MEAVAFFTSLVEEHNYLGYAALFVGMILEGEVILMAAGILVNIGAFGLWETFAVAYIGVLVNDVVWYNVGSHICNKYSERHFIKRAEAKVKKILPHIEKNPGKAIYISKFIAGINHPTLVILGFLKINFRYFMRLQVVASFLWTAFFLFLGWFFGYTAISYSHRFREFVFVAILLLIIAMLVERLISLTVEKKKE